MSFFNQLSAGVAAVADKLDDPPAAPAAAAPAAAAPAAAAPAAAAPAAAAPAAAAPAAAVPAATGAAPVDLKATLMHAAEEAKQGDYMGAVQDVMKTGLVQKLAASQGKQGDQAASTGSNDLVGNLMHQAQGMLGSSGQAGGAAGSNPLGSLLGALGGSAAAPAATGAAPAAPTK